MLAKISIPITMKSDAEFLIKIQELLQEYRSEVQTSNLTNLTKKVYIDNADNFVRWISNDFVPGQKVNNRISLD